MIETHVNISVAYTKIYTHIRYDTYMHLWHLHHTHTPDMIHTYMHACAQASHTIHTSDLYICIHQMRSTYACNIIRTVDAVHTCIHQMHYIHTYIHTSHYITYIHTYIHALHTLQTYIRTYITHIHASHAYIQALHTYIHTYTHTYIHTHSIKVKKQKNYWKQ